MSFTTKNRPQQRRFLILYRTIKQTLKLSNQELGSTIGLMFFFRAG